MTTTRQVDPEAIAELEHLLKHSHGVEHEEAERDLRALRAQANLRQARQWAKTTGRNEIRR